MRSSTRSAASRTCLVAVGSVFCTVLLALTLAPPAGAQPAEPPAADVMPPPPPPPPAPVGGLKIEGKDATIKFGFLAQPAFEYTDGSLASDIDTAGFFLRRARLMVGMTLGSSLEFFAETDSPNLGKRLGDAATPGGVAGSVGVNMQDVFVTWKPLDEFKLDVGMLLMPLSHNGLQGATSLYGWDYFAYSFQQNTAMGSYVGRDNGVQARGLIAKHLEYRLGLFTGRRVALPAVMGVEPPQPSRTALRVAGRLQYNVFDAETTFFYGGTYGGTKRILSFGGGFDIQKEYKAFAGDIFFDWPLGNDVVTWQVDVVRYDGGDWATAIIPQTDLMAEAGYRFGALKLSPIVRFEMAQVDEGRATAGMPDQKRLGVGLAWWYMGHNANVKLFYTNITSDADPAMAGGAAPNLRTINQVNLQMQFYVF
jgi:hypothetical protein